MQTLKEHIKGTALFVKYRKNELHYTTTETGFNFTVPIEDFGDGEFLRDDKAILLMRYIRENKLKLMPKACKNNMQLREALIVQQPSLVLQRAASDEISRLDARIKYLERLEKRVSENSWELDNLRAEVYQHQKSSGW